ncbi:MAG: HAMP domain-containing sensor histidine kinase [Trueperaceae bacterium]|nr:HAMP domain-containing sensor histidine kinase [Trueperaceae bacterium]
MRPPRWPRLSSRTTTRIAFAVIVVFLLAQVVWWLLFQRSYIEGVSESRLAAWRNDAAVAQAAWDTSGHDPALRDAVLSQQPHLTFQDGTFRVDPARREAFLREQRGYLRMFAWEGPFFVLVMLAMLALIARSLREERALKRSQQNFLSAITHEFKTPLATLRLLVETAQVRDLSPERRRDYLTRMVGELDRLERTSEQVLAAARLEQAPLATDLRPVDLGAVVRRLVEEARPGLEARGATVRRVPPEGRLPVSLDEDAFAMVLSNLLDNAVKYSPGEDKPVTVRLEEGPDVVMLHVDDEGVGVPAAERDKIFGRFYRSGDESTRRAIGTGLGLHLARSTVEAMNGWMRVQDAPSGRGTRFTVVFPRRVEAAGQARDAPSTPAAEEGR